MPSLAATCATSRRSAVAAPPFGEPIGSVPASPNAAVPRAGEEKAVVPAAAAPSSPRKTMSYPTARVSTAHDVHTAHSA